MFQLGMYLLHMIPPLETKKIGFKRYVYVVDSVKTLNAMSQPYTILPHSHRAVTPLTIMKGTCMNFKKLIGKTLIRIEGMTEGSEEVKLHCSDGTLFTLYHPQDCCEQVELYDVCGDVKDLLNTPIIVADETTNTTGASLEDWHDSWTWTFYKLATVKGWVDLRWYGHSNGYYSEEVETHIKTYEERVAEIRHEYGRNRITAEERDNLIMLLRTDYERLLI